jgi:hypothetical protein
VDSVSRRVGYENLRAHNLKYKSSAKERRKERRREKQGGLMTPRDTGEEVPPFFLPARYKLLFKCLQDQRNSNRFTRKPMPEAERANFIAKSKEYSEYKQYEV